jgi:NitT/TauT family transport system ATP-binding protein
MTRERMQTELGRIAGETGAAVVFVTHSIPEAVYLSDRVVVMSPRPGRIAEIIDIDLPRPRTVETRATAEFGRFSLAIYDILTGRRADTPGQPLQALA